LIEFEHLTGEDGYILASNDQFAFCYSRKTFGDQAVNHVMTSLALKKQGKELASGQMDGVWVGFARGYSTLSSLDVLVSTNAELVFKATWSSTEGRCCVRTIKILDGSPVLKIAYGEYGVNVVDLGYQRGKTDTACTYTIHGADAWVMERKAMTDQALRQVPNPHDKLTDELYPSYPFPLYRRVWSSHPALSYNGYMLMGITYPGASDGYVRIMPTQHIEIIKLVSSSGFECFPHYGNPHEPFTGALIPFADGVEAAIEAAKKIIDAGELTAE